MLDTPPAPTLVAVDSRKISLSWKSRSADKSTRDPSAVQKMLADWAGSHGENDGGVSIETVFAKYDRDGSGDIDARELALVLEDLGVEANEERLREAFALLDANGDGIISFDEFAGWWRREQVVYVLKRSEPIYAVRCVSVSGGHILFCPITGHDFCFQLQKCLTYTSTPPILSHPVFLNSQVIRCAGFHGVSWRRQHLRFPRWCSSGRSGFCQSPRRHP